MKSHASKSMLFVGVYLIFLGFSCLFFPEFVLEGLGVYTVPDIFSRMTGMIFLVFSYIYIRTGLKDKGMEFFFLITAQERLTIPIFLTTFYLLGYAEWPIVAFGFFDMGLGIWTWIALKIDKKNKINTNKEFNQEETQ
ncbi:MAG: hypothetical protein ACFE9R_10725 [Candidatus Hermodarchaeota archaeon]